MQRLHDQAWVKGDYSDVIVAMSKVYSRIRGDVENEAKESDRQVLFFSRLRLIFILPDFEYAYRILLDRHENTGFILITSPK